MLLRLCLLLVSYPVFVLAFRALASPGFRGGTTLRTALAAITVVTMLVVTLWVDCSPWALAIVGISAAIATIVLPEPGLRRFGECLGRRRFVIYILAVATTSALIFVFLPITTFLTSPGELSLHLEYLVTVNARDAMVVVYLAAAIYCFLFSDRLRTAATLTALVALGLALVYAYVLPFGYPMMSGLAFEQVPVPATTLALRLVLDIVVVAAVAVGVCLLLLRRGSRPLLIGILLIDLSLGVATAISARQGEIGTAGGGSPADLAAARPLRFSPDHDNVLFLFLDRFMGGYIEPILASDPGLAQRLAGFTWYPRTVSAGENSIAGVHPMLGGYDYTPFEMNRRGTPLRDQSVEAFSILPYNFSRKGYQVNVVNPRGLGFTMAGDCRFMVMDRVNCTHIPMSIMQERARAMSFPLSALSKSNYADLLVLLASMRGSPYVVKHALFERGPWRPFLDHSAGTTFREWAELTSLHELSATDAREPNFNFISNILPHEPYYMGEDCKPRRERFELPGPEIRARGHPSLFSLQHAVTARCALLATADYLDFLRRAGVYDRTAIVIVSDHGIVGPVEDRSSRALAGGTHSAEFVRTRSVLLFKPIGATGDLRTSEAFMPNAEAPRLVCAQIGGCVNPYRDDRPIAAQGRDDPFHVAIVPWQFSAQKPDAFVIRSAYELRGRDPYDASGWVLTSGAR